MTTPPDDRGVQSSDSASPSRAVPRVLDVAARVTLVVAAVGGTCLVGIALAHIVRGKGVPGGLITVAILAVVSLLLWIALRLPPGPRLGTAFTLALLVGAVYAAELYLTLRPPPSVPQIMAHERGGFFDARYRFQVVKDLRMNAQRAYPALSARFLRGGEGQLRFTLVLGGDTVVPLSPGPAGATTVFCNETGEYLTYVADEFGFNNPRGLWRRESVDIAIIGDSFAQGACVPPQDHFVSRIRLRQSRTLSAGVSGAGPLHMLALLREYLWPVRPRHVVWSYYEGNDLQDLRDELDSPALRAYLAKGFRHGLPEQQVDVDRQRSRFLDSLLAHFPQPANSMREYIDGVTPLVTLTALRTVVGFDRPSPTPADVDVFERVLLAARDAVASWGGTLHFVYLPTYRRFAGHDHEHYRLRAGVRAAVRRAGLPLADLVPAFRSAENPRAFWYHPRGHYSERGNMVVADSILSGIEEWERQRADDRNRLRTGPVSAAQRAQ